MPVGLGFSSAFSVQAAADEAAAMARSACDGQAAEHALVFATGSWGAQLEALLDAAEDALEGATLHGGAFPGVFAGGGSAIGNPGLAIALLPGVRLGATLLEELPLDDPHAPVELADHMGAARPGEALQWLAGDFAGEDASAFFGRFAGMRGTAVGAGHASGAGISIWSGAVRSEGGLLALEFEQPARPRIDLVPRCRPIDKPRPVSRARDNWVSAIGESIALDVLRDAARRAHLDENAATLRRMIVEVAHDGGSALRPIAGIDFDRGAILVPGQVKAGDRLRFAVVDAVAAQENLEHVGEARDGGAAPFGLFLSGAGSDPAGAREFAREARWFADRPVLGLASGDIFGPTHAQASTSQALPACSLWAEIGG